MDNTIQTIQIILIVLLVILCVVGVGAIALKVKSSIDYDKVRKTAKRDRHFLGRLLATQYSQGQYLLNITLPYGPDGKDVGPVDAIVVVKGGIAIITANYYSGKITNPYQGQWSITDSHGQVYVFNNLFEQNLAVLESVKTIMRRESVFNTPIHNLVMFGAKNVKLSRNEAQLLTADTLIPYLHDLDKDKFLKASQKRKIIKIFNKYRRKKSAPNPTATFPGVSRRMSQTSGGMTSAGIAAASSNGGKPVQNRAANTGYTTQSGMAAARTGNTDSVQQTKNTAVNQVPEQTSGIQKQ